MLLGAALLAMSGCFTLLRFALVRASARRLYVDILESFAKGDERYAAAARAFLVPPTFWSRIGFTFQRDVQALMLAVTAVAMLLISVNFAQLAISGNEPASSSSGATQSSGTQTSSSTGAVAAATGADDLVVEIKSPWDWSTIHVGEVPAIAGYGPPGKRLVVLVGRIGNSAWVACRVSVGDDYIWRIDPLVVSRLWTPLTDSPGVLDVIVTTPTPGTERRLGPQRDSVLTTIDADDVNTLLEGVSGRASIHLFVARPPIP